MIRIRPIQHSDIAGCIAILRSLPQWFGIEDSIIEYGKNLEHLDGFVALEGSEMVGFVGLKRYGDRSIEIDVVGVKPELRRSGIGSRLIDAVEANVDAAIRLLHVKTLAPSDPDPNYAATRAFWLAKGFIPMDAHELWGPENPCLVMVKPIAKLT